MTDHLEDRDESIEGAPEVAPLSDEEKKLLGMKLSRSKGRFKKDDDGPPGVAITSLMDAMTILLVFLLVNVGDEPVSVTQADELKLPESNTELMPEDTISITVSGKAINVGPRHAVDVSNGQVDKSRKKGGETSLLISPVYDMLTEEANHQKRIASMSGSSFKGLATIIAHKDTPFRLLTEVMYTAGQAEFSNFKFCVVKKFD